MIYDNRREFVCTFDIDPRYCAYSGDYLLDVKEEIIRCVDCRYYRPIASRYCNKDEYEGICAHPHGCVGTDPDGFCHNAQRREK